MKKLQYHQFGDPLEVLELVEEKTPTPNETEVLIRVEAVPIHPSALMTIKGLYGTLPKAFPAGAGNEGVGVIEAIGEQVSNLAVGMRVFLPADCSAWSTHIVAEAKGVYPAPEQIDLLQAAMLRANPPSALLLLQEFVDLQPGDWAVINGANSGVGIAMNVIAKEKQINILNLVRSEKAKEHLQSQGFEHVLITDDEELVTQAKTLFADRKCRLAVDMISGEATEILANCLSRGGTLVSFGAMTEEVIQIQPGHFIFRGLTLKGFWISQWYEQAPTQKVLELFNYIGKLIATGKLSTPIDQTYSLEEYPQAIKAAADGRRQGKILFKPFA